MECLEVGGECVAYFGEFLYCIIVDGLQFTCGGYIPAKVFVGEHHGAVNEVAEDCHQLGVVAALEVAPSEVVVLSLRGICGQDVAQHILLPWEVAKVFVEPDCPVARCGNLVTFEVQELIGGHIVGELEIIAVGHQHRGEDDAVEHYVVLAYEVDDSCLGVFPIGLPSVGKQFLGVGDIADRGIEPHVEHFPVGTLDGYRHTPVEVAAHGSRLQTEVNPRLALAVDIGFPFLVPLENPSAQFAFPSVERQVPVLCLLQHRGVARYGAFGIDEVGGVEGCAARLALVAVGTRVVAMGAFAGHVAVG